MKLFELYADLSLDASKFDSGINKATKAGNTLSGTLKGGLGGAAKFVGNQVSATTVMLGNLMTDVAHKGVEIGKQIVSTGIDYNRQMEMYTTNFTTMLDGSAAAAEKLTGNLEEMAATTPFAMTDLADATQTLLQFGQDSESVLGTLQSLGDIAMGDSQKLQSLTLAFAQASSSGKLMGQDLMQMINAGFNPLQTIVDKTGASMADLKEFMSSGKASDVLKKQMQKATEEVARMGEEASDGAKMLVQMAEDGAISAELLGQIFNIETSPGGKFYKAMENASKTFNGMVSTLEDDTSALMGKVMEPAFDFLTDTLLPKAIDVVGELDEAYDLGGLTGMASKATEILEETLGTWGTVAFDAGSGMLAQVLSGLTGDTVNADEIKKTLAGLWDGATDKIQGIIDLGGGLITGIYEGLMEDGNEKNVIQKVSGLWSEGQEALDGLIDAGKGLMGTIWQGITGEEMTAKSIGNKVAGVFNAGVDAIMGEDGDGGLIGVATNLMRDLDTALKGDPQSENQISTFLSGLFDAAGKGMSGVIETSGSFLSNLYNTITGDSEGAEKIKNLFSDVGEAVQETTEEVSSAAKRTGQAYNDFFREISVEWDDTEPGDPTFFGFVKKTVDEGMVPTPEEDKSQLPSAHEELSLLSQLIAAAPLIIADAGKDFLDDLFYHTESGIDLSDYDKNLLDQLGTLYASGPYAGGIDENTYDDLNTIIMQGKEHELYDETAKHIEELSQIHDLYQGLGDLEMGYGMEAVEAEGIGWESVKESIDSETEQIGFLQETVETLKTTIADMQAAIDGLSVAANTLARRQLQVVLDGRTMAQSIAPYSSEIMSVSME